MLRTLIAKLRLLIFGPVLNRFSRLTPGQVESLMLLANEGSLIKPSSGPRQSTTPSDGLLNADVTNELNRLRSKVAELSERVSVLERVYKK